MNEKQLLADRIKALCIQNKMTYYDLSYKSAVPLTTLMNIVNCSTRNPGIFTLAKICSGLDITLKDFFDTDVFYGIEYEID